MTLTPAYSRDYKSLAEVAASLRKPEDWRGIDRMQEAYTSLPELPDGMHEIRYWHLMKVAVLVKKGETVTLNGKAI